MSMLKRNKNKYSVEAGDVFLFCDHDDLSISEAELFLVEKANEFVYSGGYGGIGYQGPVAVRFRDDPRGYNMALEHTTSRYDMNKRIAAGGAVRIAHFNDLRAAHAAMEAWSLRETDALVVPVPSSAAESKLTAAA